MLSHTAGHQQRTIHVCVIAALEEPGQRRDGHGCNEAVQEQGPNAAAASPAIAADSVAAAVAVAAKGREAPTKGVRQATTQRRRRPAVPQQKLSAELSTMKSKSGQLASRCIAVAPEKHRAPAEGSEASSVRRSNASHMT